MTAQRDDAVGREAAKAACRQGQELFQLRRREANEQAVALFRRAVESDPTYAPAYVGLATAMCEAMVRYGQPRTLANEALDLALRAVSLGRGNTAAAQEEVEVMLGHRPDDPETLNFAADVALLLGNPEQARTFYERAIDLGSDSRNFYRGRRAKTGLGYLLWVHGEREAALRLLDERREIRMREFAEGLNAWGPPYELAVISAVVGHTALALSWLQKAADRGWREPHLAETDVLLGPLHDRAELHDFLTGLRRMIGDMRRKVKIPDLPTTGES